MPSQDRSAPTPRDAKRLFALSGNRCAFPKCRAAIVQGGALIGEISHIRAAHAGGPRYDPGQTSAERHSFANLMLLCANHHKVVDDDPEAYTVDRLLKMKADHEDHASTINDEDMLRTFQLLVDQSVTTYGQSGGIAAQTINAGAINLHAGPSSGVAETRTTQAIEALWAIMVRLKQVHSALIFVDTILTADELRACFAGQDSNAFFEILAPYRSLDTLAQKFETAGGAAAQKEQPFVSPRLYGLFFAVQAVLGRTGALIHFSFEKQSFKNWRDDAGINQHLSAVLTSEAIAALRALPTFALQTVIGTLEAEFLREADSCRAGSRRM